jgi:DNA-binding protein HU-beta
MTKTQLIAAIADETGFTKSDLATALDSMAKVVTAELRRAEPGTRISIPGLVNLKVRWVPARKSRTGRSPLTGETIVIAAKPAHYAVKAAPAKELKAAIVGKKKAR